MSTITQSVWKPHPLASPAVYRMKADEFERIADSLDDDHVELIDGYIIESEDMKPAHVLTSERLRKRLEIMLPAGWSIREDKPLRLSEYDEPRPDIAVVRGDPEKYGTQHPGPADVAFLIEIANASLFRDRNAKFFSYALASIGTYWIVNVTSCLIEVYTDPAPGGYATQSDYKRGENVPVVVDGIEVGSISVDDIFR